MLPNRKRFRSPLKYLLACGSEILSPLLRSFVRSDRETAPRAWRRGVILGADHIGDVLYNTASLSHLREGLPECRWSYVADAPANQVLAGNPNIEEVISRSAAKEMPAGSFDVALCYNSGSTLRDLLFAARLKIPNRVGYPDKGFSGLVTFPIKIQYPQPYPAYFRDLVGQLTARSPDWSLRPQVFSTAGDAAMAEAAWKDLELSSDAPVVACFVTSRQASGVWPAEKFARTLQLVEENIGVQTILLGSQFDEPILRQMKDDFHLRAGIASGILSLPELVCFLQRCQVVISTDSGPRHLANAAGVPVVYVRNISFSKVEAGPYCDRNHDLAPEVEFVPVERQRAILETVDPIVVADTVNQLLRGGASEASPFPGPVS